MVIIQGMRLFLCTLLFVDGSSDDHNVTISGSNVIGGIVLELWT